MWAFREVRRGEHRTEVVPFPAACESCTEDIKELHGCGFEERYAGKGHKGRFGADREPENRTCPRYFFVQPGVQWVLEKLRDYKRGALGCVLDMEAPLLQLLRHAEVEQDRWAAEQNADIAARLRNDRKETTANDRRQASRGHRSAHGRR